MRFVTRRGGDLGTKSQVEEKTRGGKEDTRSGWLPQRSQRVRQGKIQEGSLQPRFKKGSQGRKTRRQNADRPAVWEDEELEYEKGGNEKGPEIWKSEWNLCGERIPPWGKNGGQLHGT